MSGSIYIASKVRHAALWKALRDEDGCPIKSSWIDLAAPGVIQDWNEHWWMCLREATSADVLVIYAAKGDNMKGALIEAGAALVRGVTIFVVGDEAELGSWINMKVVWRFSTIEEAFEAARARV